MIRSRRLRGVALVGGGTVVAAAFGLGFQSLLAYWFGAGAETDAWFMSLSIFAFLAKFLLLANVKSIALPLYRGLGGAGAEPARRMARGLLARMLLATALLSAALAVAAPLLVDLLAPGYEGGQRALTATLLRIRTPALVALAATSAALVVAESAHRFGVGVLAQKIVPAVLTLALLVAVGDRWGMVAVGWVGLAGVVAGGVVALAAVARDLRPAPTALRDAAAEPAAAARAALRSVGRQWIRFGGSNGATFLAEWVFRVAASLLPVGLFSAVLYGRMVHDLLHGAVNDAAQTVSLPRFADLARPSEEAATAASSGPAAADTPPPPGAGRAGPSGDAALGEELGRSLGALAAASLPLATFVAVAAPWLIELLFARGRFAADGMAGPAAVALAIYAVGFVVQGLNQLVFAALFASGRSHLVNRVQIVGHLARAAMLVPAVWAFSYVGLVGAQVAMNVLVLAALLVVAPAAWGLRRGAVARLARVGLAAAAPAVLWAALGRPLLPGAVGAGTWTALAVLAALGAGWGLVYVTAALLLGVAPVRAGLRRLRPGVLGAALLLAAAAGPSGSAEAQDPAAVTRAPLSADHWSRDVLAVLEARGRVPAGAARTPFLPASRAARWLAAAEDPLAGAAYRRFLEEWGGAPGGPVVAGTVQAGGRWDAAPGGAGSAVAGAEARIGSGGGPGGRSWFGAARVEAGGDPAEVRLVRGTVGIRLGPLDVQAGRHRVRLGGGRGGSLVLSPAAALDGVVVGAAEPWSLGAAGTLEATVGVFPFAPDQSRVEDPWLALATVRYRPSSWLVLSLDRAAQVGGRFAGGTAPFETEPKPPDDGDVGPGDVLSMLVGRVTGRDNQVVGVGVEAALGGFGVPALLYGQIGLEDDTRSFGDGALLAGVLLAPPAGAAAPTLRYEYVGIGDAGRWCAWCDTLPAFWYQHTRFQDGWVSGDALLGHPLGGYGRSHRMEVGWADPRRDVRVVVAGLRLRRDRWNLLEGARPGDAWGLGGAGHVRLGGRVRARARIDVEWGDAGWRTGHVEVGLARLLGGR